MLVWNSIVTYLNKDKFDEFNEELVYNPGNFM